MRESSSLSSPTKFGRAIMLKEIKDAPGYFLDEEGNVFSAFSNKVLSVYMTEGYPAVKLQIKGKQTSVLLHRIVAHVYGKLDCLFNPDLEVDHKDRDRLNYNLDNLQVLTKYEHQQKTNKDNGWSDSKIPCPSCGSLMLQRSITCSSCKPKPTGAVVRPDIVIEELIDKVIDTGWVKAAKYFEISESTLRRRYTKLTGLSPKVLTEQRKSK